MTAHNRRVSPAPSPTLVLTLVACLSVAAAASSMAQTSDRWVGTWATGLQAQVPPDPTTAEEGSVSSQLFGPPIRVENQTLRQIVRTSIGGEHVRVVVTNTFGTAPLEIGAAHVALRSSGPAISSSDRAPLSFGGQPSTIVEPGAMIVSDPVDLRVPALGDLAVDLYLPGDSWANGSPATLHLDARATNYLSTAGNHAGATELPVAQTLTSWMFLARVEVTAAANTNVVVTLGDSITDGYASTVDANTRWPDILAERFVAALGDAAPAVLNVGISGNRVLRGNEPFSLTGDAPTPAEPLNPNAGFGPSAIARFDRDVLLQPGVSHVIVLESINDIGMGRGPAAPTADDLIAGHLALIQRAHAHGVKIYGGTLTPFEGAGYYSEAGEATRQTVNTWIRTSGAYDAVIDFDAAVGDPSRPQRFLEDYQPGDWLHPNDAGYRRMGEVIYLSLFTDAYPEPVFTTSAAAPRTEWGAPDLRGIWDYRTITPLERPSVFEGKAVLTAEEAAAFRQQAIEGRNNDRRSDNAAADVEGAYNDFWWDWGDDLTDNRTSLIVDPPDGRVPALVANAATQSGTRPFDERPVRTRLMIGSPVHTPEDLGLSERCLLGFSSGPPILPSAYNNNLQIFQTPDHVVLLTEVIHEARIIPLDRRPHLSTGIQQWLGDSRGYWDGDTLVVETTNYTDKTGAFNTLTYSHGLATDLHLVERFTRADDGTLVYEFTINDPKTFAQPLTAVIPMKGSEFPLYEYACHEGNYAMEGMLAGARAAEAEAEAEAASGSR